MIRTTSPLDIPPIEFEQQYYEQHNVQAMVAGQLAMEGHHHLKHGNSGTGTRGITPTVDSYDNALAETIIGLFKTEVIHPRGPWRRCGHWSSGIPISVLHYVPEDRQHCLCVLKPGQDFNFGPVYPDDTEPELRSWSQTYL